MITCHVMMRRRPPLSRPRFALCTCLDVITPILDLTVAAALITEIGKSSWLPYMNTYPAGVNNALDSSGHRPSLPTANSKHIATTKRLLDIPIYIIHHANTIDLKGRKLMHNIANVIANLKAVHVGLAGYPLHERSETLRSAFGARYSVHVSEWRYFRQTASASYEGPRWSACHSA